mgnify:CR=1 FL=1
MSELTIDQYQADSRLIPVQRLPIVAVWKRQAALDRERIIRWCPSDNRDNHDINPCVT